LGVRVDGAEPRESRQPAYSMDWLNIVLSEEAITKELDARQRIEEAMQQRRC
jgi:hypothetical protein